MSGFDHAIAKHICNPLIESNFDREAWKEQSTRLLIDRLGVTRRSHPGAEKREVRALCGPVPRFLTSPLCAVW